MLYVIIGVYGLLHKNTIILESLLLVNEHLTKVMS